MEELLDTRSSVFSHDFWLLPHHLYGTYCSYTCGKCLLWGGFGCKKNKFMFCTVFVKTQNEAHSLNLLLVAELCSHVSALLPSSDPGHVCPNQVFPRNYHHWLQSLPFL